MKPGQNQQGGTKAVGDESRQDQQNSPDRDAGAAKQGQTEVGAYTPGRLLKQRLHRYFLVVSDQHDSENRGRDLEPEHPPAPAVFDGGHHHQEQFQEEEQDEERENRHKSGHVGFD